MFVLAKALPHGTRAHCASQLADKTETRHAKHGLPSQNPLLHCVRRSQRHAERYVGHALKYRPTFPKTSNLRVEALNEQKTRTIRITELAPCYHQRRQSPLSPYVSRCLARRTQALWQTVSKQKGVIVRVRPDPFMHTGGLTSRSSGRQHGPSLRDFDGPCWCPTPLRGSGATYLGR